MKKKTNAITLILLALCVAVPLVLFNGQPGVFSDADNRRLYDMPEETESFGEFTAAFDEYVSDRIGLRSQEIGLNQLLNNSLLHVMTHPSYDYGEGDYLFHKFTEEEADTDFLLLFSERMGQIQEYCDERGIHFLYVNTPNKTFIYDEYVPDYIGSQLNCMDYLSEYLDDFGVTYVDLTDDLIAAKESGVQVFNEFYDANHWNTEGALVGANAIVDALRDQGLTDVQSIDVSDYEAVYTHQDYLPASRFPISMDTYQYIHKEDGRQAVRVYDFDGCLRMDETYSTYSIWENPNAGNDLTVLMFQGSYFNTQGTMLYNQFAKTYCIHDYQNIFDLVYYVDVFQPDIIIFETADYTICDEYYDFDLMAPFDPPAAFNAGLGWGADSLPGGAFSAARTVGKRIIDFGYACDTDEIEYAYAEVNGVVYDCQFADGHIVWSVDAQRCGSPTSVTLYARLHDGSRVTSSVPVIVSGAVALPRG